MIKFIHTADIHFGMENYGRVDAQTGIHSRLLDFNKAFEFCINKAIEENVDFFLFAGDAYKTTTPSPTQQKLFFKNLMKLHKANIPVVIIIGNHDNPLSFGKSNSLEILSELPIENFHIFSKPGILKLDTKNGPIQIVGIPWPTRNNLATSEKHMHKNSEQITQYISESVTALIHNYAKQLDASIPSILAAHLTVANGIFSGSEKRAIYGTDPVFLPSDLAIKPFDYVALGHLHRHQNLNPNGYPNLVYSGSIERVDFGERKEKKGFCLISIQEKNKTSYEFIETPTRNFIQVDVKLIKGEDQTKQILNALSKYNLNDAILKIIYHIPEGCADKVDLKEINTACANVMELVGAIPIRTQTERIFRASVKTEMTLEELLANYFNSKPELKCKKEALIKRAMELQEEALSKADEEL
ncbi:MAG: Nuclease SbcCD, D subunit [candidate division TM6 bacterium GW2011_GWF2_32_72]|nr:MAG: Nuclease SbcCD, D subunit [candidate division TM6 bacterium GW2011_GWF2_32_72]